MEGRVGLHANYLRERAQQWVRFLRFIPFSRAYLLVGSTARGNVHRNSDIDVVAIARTNYVWLHRALLFLFLVLTGWRRTRATRSGKLCIAGSVAHSYNGGANRFFSSAVLLTARPEDTLLEHILVFSGLAWVGEHLAHHSISWYINKRLGPVADHPDTVVSLTSDTIIYFPPRASAHIESSLDALCERRAL